MPKVIAIDGPAGAGKSTVARRLAEKLGFTYLDSGALYRAVTWYLLNGDAHLINGRDSAPSDTALEEALRPVDIRLDNGRILVGRDDVTDRIRDMRVSQCVSLVSERRPVRAKLLSIQRASATQDIVVEGRDIGTVVFPSAFLKVFLDADVAIRSHRRLKELSDAGVSTDYDEVFENLRMRDDRDSHREIAPLTRAADAVYLDTTYLETEEVVDTIRNLVVRGSRRWYGLWKTFFYRLTWTILGALFRLYLFRRSAGAEGVDGLKGPAILASNHMSFLDPPLVAVSMNRPLHFLAKRELTEIPVFGQVILWLSAIPVRRGILDREALDQVRATLAGGGLVLIFPEGTRSRDGTIHDAKAGFGKLVLESGVPVVPVRIVGSHRSYPPGSYFPRPSPVRVVFGAPFRPSGRPAPSATDPTLRDRYEAIGEEVMERIRALAGE